MLRLWLLDGNDWFKPKSTVTNRMHFQKTKLLPCCDDSYC